MEWRPYSVTNFSHSLFSYHINHLQQRPKRYTSALVQDCRISIASTVELGRSCTKLQIYILHWYGDIWPDKTLKWKCDFENIFVASCTKNDQSDSWCSNIWKSCQNYDNTIITLATSSAPSDGNFWNGISIVIMMTCGGAYDDNFAKMMTFALWKCWWPVSERVMMKLNALSYIKVHISLVWMSTVL